MSYHYHYHYSQDDVTGNWHQNTCSNSQRFPWGPSKPTI